MLGAQNLLIYATPLCILYSTCFSYMYFLMIEKCLNCDACWSRGTYVSLGMYTYCKNQGTADKLL